MKMKYFCIFLFCYTSSIDALPQFSKQEIDTSYLPVHQFSFQFFDKHITDSALVLSYIEYLEAFDEPSIYHSSIDSVLRILTIPSFRPAKLIKIQKCNSEFVVIEKTGSRIEIDASHFEQNSLTKKEQRQLDQILNSWHMKDFAMSSEDSIICQKAWVKDTIEFGYTTIEKNFNRDRWPGLFEQTGKGFYELATKLNQSSVALDGYSRLIEVRTILGYHVISRSSASQEEAEISDLIGEIEDLLK